MKVIAFYNIKGGVGKTAGCVNLAYLASLSGQKVLVWDLDPQAAATFYLEGEAKLKTGFKKMLEGSSDLSANIQETAYENLTLIPAEFNNRHLDLLLDDARQHKKRMKTLLASLRDQVDYVFIDCPPGIGVLSEMIFSVANAILVPTIPTTLSIRAYDILKNYFDTTKEEFQKVYFYFNMADTRKNLHNQTLEAFSKNRQFLKTYIPYLSVIEKMGERLAPVNSYAPSSYGALCYQDLWNEVNKKIIKKL